MATVALPTAVIAQSEGSVRGAVTSADHRAILGARVAIETPQRVASTDAKVASTVNVLTPEHEQTSLARVAGPAA